MDYNKGDKVLAVFTNAGEIIRFIGEIVKVNQSSYRIKSLEGGVRGWEKGHEFIIQSELSPLHSSNNRIIKKVEWS